MKPLSFGRIPYQPSTRKPKPCYTITHFPSAIPHGSNAIDRIHDPFNVMVRIYITHEVRLLSNSPKSIGNLKRIKTDISSKLLPDPKRGQQRKFRWGKLGLLSASCCSLFCIPALLFHYHSGLFVCRSCWTLRTVDSCGSLCCEWVRWYRPLGSITCRYSLERARSWWDIELLVDRRMWRHSLLRRWNSWGLWSCRESWRLYWCRLERCLNHFQPILQATCILELISYKLKVASRMVGILALGELVILSCTFKFNLISV